MDNNMGWDVSQAAADASSMNSSTAYFLWSNNNQQNMINYGVFDDLQEPIPSNNINRPQHVYGSSLQDGTGGSSLDSLDHHHCLLSSTTNTTDDTNSSDDGRILMIFSNYSDNLWNFGSTTPPPHPPLITSRSDISSNSERASLLKLTTEANNNNPPNPNPNPNSKKLLLPRSEKVPISSNNINFRRQPNQNSPSAASSSSVAQMKEMMYRAAALRPVVMGAEVVAEEKPKRKNVRISKDSQTVAARQRRERIGERIRALQKLVPGGSKMDTASMLDEAANYLKFLRSQVKSLENQDHSFDHHQYHFLNNPNPISFPPQNYFHHSFPTNTNNN